MTWDDHHTLLDSARPVINKLGARDTLPTLYKSCTLGCVHKAFFSCAGYLSNVPATYTRRTVELGLCS